MKLREVLEQGARILPHDRPDSVISGTGSADDHVQHLETVLSVIRRINTSLILSDVLALVMDHAIRITQSERGFLALADAAGELRYAIGHDKRGNVIPSESFNVSKSVLNDVFLTGESLCIEDALTDSRFESRQSV
ncbi:MAG TPA: GAF domain-containing protein, partial [Bacteroidota bacterium]|nr:GAF domain-containing protein [Bacteroidota bacterium]